MLHAEAGMAEQSGLVLGVPEHLVRDRPRLIRSSSVPGMTAGSFRMWHLPPHRG